MARRASRHRPLRAVSAKARSASPLSSRRDFLRNRRQHIRISAVQCGLLARNRTIARCSPSLESPRFLAQPHEIRLPVRRHGRFGSEDPAARLDPLRRLPRTCRARGSRPRSGRFRHASSLAHRPAAHRRSMPGGISVVPPAAPPSQVRDVCHYLSKSDMSDSGIGGTRSLRHKPTGSPPAGNDMGAPSLRSFHRGDINRNCGKRESDFLVYWECDVNL
jgi:hypothetical protein